MTPSKPHPVIAATADSYFIVFLVGGIIALHDKMAGRESSEIGVMLAYLATLMGISLYYLILHTMIPWLTPGERLAGRIFEGGKKIWVNPYGRNRWFLFLVIILDLTLVSDNLDLPGAMGQSFLRFLLSAALLIILSFGAVMAGKRNTGMLWMTVPAAACLFLPHPPNKLAGPLFDDLYTVWMPILYGSLILFNGMAFYAYRLAISSEKR